jgi:hypothetical protein
MSLLLLRDLLEHEIYPRLQPEDIYTAPEHQWKHQSTRKWQGGCPGTRAKAGPRSSYPVIPYSGGARGVASEEPPYNTSGNSVGALASRPMGRTSLPWCGTLQRWQVSPSLRGR